MKCCCMRHIEWELLWLISSEKKTSIRISVWPCQPTYSFSQRTNTFSSAAQLSRSSSGCFRWHNGKSHMIWPNRTVASHARMEETRKVFFYVCFSAKRLRPIRSRFGRKFSPRPILRSIENVIRENACSCLC